MNLQTLGTNISAVGITSMDSRGFRLYVNGKEHYLPFQVFPWFADATIRQISHVEQQGTDHFHWPDLDVDLTLDMIDNPEKYPRRCRCSAASR